MNNEKLREEIRQVVQACPFGPLTELLNRCYVALGERPAHDVASVPEWWKIERSFDVLPHPCVDGKSHQPTIKIVLPACAPNDMAAFDMRDQIAETVRKLLAAPSAPAAPKGGDV